MSTAKDVSKLRRSLICINIALSKLQFQLMINVLKNYMKE